MKHYRLWIIFLLVFLSGLLVGVVVTRHVARNMVAEAIANPDGIWERFVDRLSSDLQLDPKQEASIKRIVEESRSEFQSHREDVGPTFRSIIDRMLLQVSQELTPEQKDIFGSMERDHPFLQREQ